MHGWFAKALFPQRTNEICAFGDKKREISIFQHTAKQTQNSDYLIDFRKLNPYAGIIRTGSTGAFSGIVFTIPPRQPSGALSQTCDSCKGVGDYVVIERIGEVYQNVGRERLEESVPSVSY